MPSTLKPTQLSSPPRFSFAEEEEEEEDEEDVDLDDEGVELGEEEEEEYVVQYVDEDGNVLHEEVQQGAATEEEEGAEGQAEGQDNLGASKARWREGGRPRGSRMVRAKAERLSFTVFAPRMVELK